MSIIKLKEITRYYTMSAEVIRALDGVDLTIEKNQYIAIMGPSGSGKSTLMNILGCLDKPTNGSYKLDDQYIQKYSANRLADIRNQRIGFVFQSFELLPKTTALKNVELPLIYASNLKESRKKLATEALKRVGLEDRMHHKPNELSGGQKQRVAIARALVNNPAILIADEPTGNLDSKTTEQILALFRELHRQGQTIIMVTHEQDVAENAQRIITMRDGKIVNDIFNKQEVTCD